MRLFGFLIAFLMIVPAISLAQSEQSSSLDGKVHKDWVLSCGGQDERSPEVCAMRQRLIDSNGNLLVMMAVGKSNIGENPGLLIVLPLGISISQGVKLKVDERRTLNLPIERCVPRGCRVEGFIESELLGWFKSGSIATIGFVAYDNQERLRPIEVDISLAGFTAALDNVLR